LQLFHPYDNRHQSTEVTELYKQLENLLLSNTAAAVAKDVVAEKNSWNGCRIFSQP